MPSDALDQPGIDTYLALVLLRRGDLPQDQLERLLVELRRRRSEGITLARTLAERGLLEEASLRSAMAELAVHETVAPGEAPPPVTAKRLGDYALLERLGAGGMGAVYLAEHVVTGARYALKTLHGVNDPEAMLRFQREAEGQARVDAHPNVARIHSFGQQQGVLFLVMDLVEGGSLEDRLAAVGRLPPREAARIVRDLALGLAHIHAQGVLHRDLKPDNVLMQGDVPRLTDFGLAKIAGETSLTVSGTVLGTPAYMPPEQIDPTRGERGPRSDVYGLGAVLYRCLTGRAPFVGASALSIMISVLEQDPPAPRSLNREIPPQLEALCLRAMSKAAHQRPDGAELAEQLERFLSEAPSGKRGPNPVVLLLGVVGLLAGLGVALRALKPPAQANESKSEPAAQSEEAPEPAKAAQPTADPLTPALPIARRTMTFRPAAQRLHRARELIRNHRGTEAKALLEGLLFDPLTGKLNPAPGRFLAELLLGSSPQITAEPERGVRLLFEATLYGDRKSARLLGQAHFSEELRRASARRLIRLPDAQNPDPSLAAAGIAIYQSKEPNLELPEAQALRSAGHPPPPTDEAYALLWARLSPRYPEVVERVTTHDPPKLPIRPADMDRTEDGRYERAKRVMATNPALARREFAELLYRADGVLRSSPARLLAELLVKGMGGPRELEHGADLLWEAALRGDHHAARYLCWGYLSSAVRDDMELAVGPWLPELSLPPDPALSKDLFALAYDGEDQARLPHAQRLLAYYERLRLKVPELEEAYRRVWARYVGWHAHRSRQD